MSYTDAIFWGTIITVAIGLIFAAIEILRSFVGTKGEDE